MRPAAPIALLGLFACQQQQQQDTDVDPSPRCDGLMQQDEAPVVDGPFDSDGDGYVSAKYVACQEA